MTFRKVVLWAVLSVVWMVASAPFAVAAEDQPLLALDRLTFAGGVNYVWRGDVIGDGVAVVKPSEWEAGLYASYNLTPKLSLPFSALVGLDSKQPEYRAGVRIRFGRGE